jgi:hypothetical protein
MAEHTSLIRVGAVLWLMPAKDSVGLSVFSREAKSDSARAHKIRYVKI